MSIFFLPELFGDDFIALLSGELFGEMEACFEGDPEPDTFCFGDDPIITDLSTGIACTFMDATLLNDLLTSRVDGLCRSASLSLRIREASLMLSKSRSDIWWCNSISALTAPTVFRLPDSVTIVR